MATATPISCTLANKPGTRLHLESGSFFECVMPPFETVLPAQAGSYALWLHLAQPQTLTIGKLGRFAFPAGDYVYLGSARGPGGLRARLGRHLRGDGKPHWHVDYLRAAAQVRGCAYALEAGQEKGSMEDWKPGRLTPAFHLSTLPLPTECAWSQKLAALPGAGTPIPGFGASDCAWGCAAHLIHLPAFEPGRISTLFNCQIRVLKGE